VDWDEYLGGAYLFWTPLSWLALKGQYVIERFERDERFPAGTTELTTQRVPVGVRFFHPSGLGTSVTATHWNQDGKFQRLATGAIESGSDNFWTVDAAINYRLPKRYGFLTVGATNLFDQQFKFFDVDFDNPSIKPERTVFFRVTLAIP
jgi:hypothetical protein